MKMHRPGRTEIYILKDDIKSEKPTKFTLRGLKWHELDQVNQHSAMKLDDALRIHSITKNARDEERKLTAEEIVIIEKTAPMDSSMIAKLNEQHAAACKFGLVKVGDLYDAKNKKFTLAAEAFIDEADSAVLRELGSKIISMSRYSEEAIKN